MKGTAKFWLVILAGALVFGCRTQKPSIVINGEDPEGRYREQIAVAKKMLQERETWAERAEWEVLEIEGGWEVIAWRVEHPEKQGAKRYNHEGYSIIELDTRIVAVDYQHNG